MRISTLVKKVAASGITIGASAIIGSQAMADTLSDFSGLSATGGAAGLGNSSTDLPVIIGRIIGAALGLLGAVFVILVIYSGFTWMTAQGSEEKIKQAKKILSGAVIGIVLTFSAYAITTFITGSLANSLKAG
jgi:hypothetical protein